MNTLKDCDYNDNTYKLAVNEDVLKDRSTEDQILKMKEEYSKFIEEQQNKSFSVVLAGLKSKEELNRYLFEIKEEYKSIDIKADTKVPVYKPIKEDK